MSLEYSLLFNIGQTSSSKLISSDFVAENVLRYANPRMLGLRSTSLETQVWVSESLKSSFFSSSFLVSIQAERNSENLLLQF